MLALLPASMYEWHQLEKKLFTKDRNRFCIPTYSKSLKRFVGKLFIEHVNSSKQKHFHWNWNQKSPQIFNSYNIKILTAQNLLIGILQHKQEDQFIGLQMFGKNIIYQATIIKKINLRHGTLSEKR